jgi:hypothetical protein
MFREIEGTWFSERALASREARHDPLLRAWRHTHYEVGAPDPFTLLIDRPSEELRALQQAAGVKSSAFLTASNPMSREATGEENAAAHERLLDAVRQRGLHALEGQGRDPSGVWPPERSLLVPGLSLAAAVELGDAFRQAAFLWSAPDGTPRLYVLGWPP